MILFSTFFGLLAADGCDRYESGGLSSNSTNQPRTEAPLYVVDGISMDSHVSSYYLEGDADDTVEYVFEGASCGCLACEHNGKELVKGDKILVAAGDVGEIVLRNMLAYKEGFYDNKAYFSNAESPSRRVIFESQYAVVKRLRVSPGALIFDRTTPNGSWEACSTVTFRSTSNGDYRLRVTDFPPSIVCRVISVSAGREKRLSPLVKPFHEDEWKVVFRCDPDVQLGPAFPRYGNLTFVVFQDHGEEVVNKRYPFNAERIGK